MFPFRPDRIFKQYVFLQKAQNIHTDIVTYTSCSLLSFDLWIILRMTKWANVIKNCLLLVLSLSSASVFSSLLLVPSLPAATKLWPRLCFYSCLWFCPWGGSASVHAEIPAPQEAHIPGSMHPPWKHAPFRKHTPPWEACTPPGSMHPPPPGSRLRHTVNERPVRILLECILVCNNFHFVFK